MKIKKSPSKKLASLPRQLSDLIKRLETEPKEYIPAVVQELESWPHARGDMFHWVAVLDRFDEILSETCNEYNLKGIQAKPFTSQTKDVILAILNLSRILFENCTNRNIYNSYEHLSLLLNTFDMDVLQQVLQFMVRPAQRTNNPRAIRSSFVAPDDKIVELARGWNNVQTDLLRITQDLDVTPKMQTLSLQFYRTNTFADTEDQQQQQQHIEQQQQTPQQQQNTEGHQVITYSIAEEDKNNKDDIETFLALVKEYDIPKKHQFELANRIRIAKHINQPDTRSQLLGIRILAICVMSHAVSETTAQNKVFMYEPYLISQLAELVSPENQVDTNIQTFVLYALDAITRHRNKLSEVLTAVNASANHGTMMQILRKINFNNAYPQPFLDALFTFVSYLLQTQPGGQMLMSAGIISTLVQIIGNHDYTQLKNISKVVGLTDTIVNSFSTSFSAFCNANGLEILLSRIKLEVETCISQPIHDEQISPHDRLSVIKSMLKFLLRMMESSGTTDGLRNLIDSTLPHSLKSIMESPKLFGNSIFAFAINVSTTFIHNEPTSLPILQEAKLPQSFLHTIATYEAPNNEVLVAAVNAFGAMCLNPQGLEMFNAAKPLPHFFDLMTLQDFLRNPMDVDSATALGSTMDELIRHHPSLKPSVFSCVTTLIKKVLDMGSDKDGVGKSSDNSHLLQTRSGDEEVASTSVAESTENRSSATSSSSPAINTPHITEEEKSEKAECLLVSFIDLVSRFLEGLFQNQSNIKEFVEEGCPEMLLNYYSLPLLPANFSVTIASDSLSYLFRMISEVSPLPTVLAIAAKVKECIRFIIDDFDNYDKSILVEYVDVNAKETEKIERGNKLLRQFIELHGYVGLLSNICCSSVLSHGKNGVSLVTEFLSESKEESIIQLLGQLHRIMTWENLLLKDALPSTWYNYKSSSNTASTFKKGPASAAEHPLGIYSTNLQSSVTIAEESVNTTASSTNEEQPFSFPKSTKGKEKEASTMVPSAKDPRMVNIKHFKLLLTEVPQLLLPIFQVFIKFSVSRRGISILHKSQTMKLAEYMSDLLKDSIAWSPITKPDAPTCKYDYLTSVYTMTSLLLRDERMQSFLLTPLAVAFERQGGVDLLLSDFQHMWDTTVQLDQQQTAKDTDLANRINNTIESLLNVLLYISSPKSLKDSTYTAPLIQTDKNADDYFDPYEWIVALELKLIPLKEYLTCPQLLHLFSKTVSQTIIKIFQQIMKGEGSIAIASAPASSASVFSMAARSGSDMNGSFNFGLPSAQHYSALRTPVVAAERHIQTLIDMGFERAAAEQALIRCNNHISRAVDYLFSHPMPVATVTTAATAVATDIPTAETNGTSDTATDSNQATDTNTAAVENVNSSENIEQEENDDENEDDDDDEDDDEEDDEEDQDSGHDGMDATRAALSEVLTNFVEGLNNESPALRIGESSQPTTTTTNISNSENVQKIKQIRLELCETLPISLLALVDQREDLVFDVRDLLVILDKYKDNKTNSTEENATADVTTTTKTSANIITMLLDRIDEIRNDQSKSAILSSRLRLLALLLRESPMQDAMSQMGDKFSFLFDMLTFSNMGEEDSLPPWSATIFLVLEALIAQADEPKKVKPSVPKRPRFANFSHGSDDDDEDDDGEEEAEGGDDQDDAMEDVISKDLTSKATTTNTTTITQEQRGELLQCCVSLLKKTALSRDDMYAILRMIVRLTKDHESALHFVSVGGVPLLFAKPRMSLEGLQGQQAFIILILRHIVESKAVLQNTMKDIITNWLTNPRPRNMDINSFVRNNAHVALREPALFVDVTTDICRLDKWDNFATNRQIKLKKNDEKKPEEGGDNTTATATSSTSTTTMAKQASPSETVVYYLLNEIMTVHTEYTTKSKKSECVTEEDKKKENTQFVYTGFLLQCLVELISSYASCKYDIFNFCKKQNGQRATTVDGKHRSFVSLLINDLLPYSHNNLASEDSRKQQGLSTWTASTLVAMSHGASLSIDMTPQQKNELMQVRKYVLEAIIRSFKEAIASHDTASIKYSKYLALADLCHRILNARPNVGFSIPRDFSGHPTAANNNNKEDAAYCNAKIMLDKNFVSVLTSAISDIDINYPHSKTILNAMLRPLEQLTKLAIKTEEDEAAAAAVSTAEEDEDKMDTTEEGIHVPATTADENNEAPDLYRNSALGMFNAGNVIEEDEEYNSGEYSDMFGSSSEDEEEFDEDDASDLSDMSEGDGEDDEVDQEMEAIIHGRDYDSDDMVEDDEDRNDIDVEADLLDDEDEDEENGREVTWHLEDIEEETGIVHAENVDDVDDEREGQGRIRDLSDPYEEDEDEEDEIDALSDFDDSSSNLDNELETDMTDGVLLDAEDFDTPFLPIDSHEDLIMEDGEFERSRTIIPLGLRRRFTNRRSLIEGVGRFRNLNTQGQDDVITHPLLSNNNSGQPSNTNPTRVITDESLFRRPLNNWHDFERIIGDNASRMLEDLLASAPSGTQGSALRVGVQAGPSGHLHRFNIENLPSNLINAHHHSGGANANNDNTADQAQEGLTILHDFQPMTSGERWNQEAQMMYGANFAEKALKLVNGLLNILGPIAIEDERKLRAEERKRQEQQRKEDEERRKVEEEKRKVEEEKRRIEKEARAAEAAAEAAAMAAAQAQAAGEGTSENQSEITGASEASTANAATTAHEAENERTTIMIHGVPVDITGTGIDKEFLEALPDELREEIINEHMRDRPTTVQSTEDDSISPEFLDALPPEIRGVLHQEATSSMGGSLANIGSSRRRAVVADDESKPSGSAKKKVKARRHDGAAQLIEKTQLSTLVRLLFVPQTISKSLLSRLLLNLCENSKTRSYLLSYLVCVLYDDNNDLASVDNSFALLSSGGKSGKSSSSKGKKETTGTTTDVADNVPNFIAQRCLEALTHIVTNNEQSMTYFLTESESLVGLKRISTSKKGKSKDKVPNMWNKYPILVLMSLLDRSVFINNSSLMEQLMNLLSTMCRPFPILVKKYQEKLQNKQNDPAQSERPMPKPPTIPDYYLKLVVHVLTTGECSSKTFQYTLNAISHLSALEGAQQTIVNELVVDAKQSGTQICLDLENLLDVLDTTMQGTDISSAVLAPFSAATSFQAKLLRVLKTLDYMFSRKLHTSEPKEDQTANELLQAQNEKRLLQIYEDLEFLPLWKTLGSCLSIIHEKEELINVATVLLPLIESFMVVSKCTAEKGQPDSEKLSTPATEQPPSLSATATSPESFFFLFTEKHKKVLNIMVRNNPTLMSGSFALLVHNPKMLEFDNKRNYFVQQLHKRTAPREAYAALQLNIRRQYVFEDSYHQLQGRTGEEIKNGKLAVRFYDEEGVDAGGVTREWFSVLARQMFDPNYALFITSAADKLTYQPNRDSAVNSDHLSFFKFVGRVIGKAIYDGRLLDAYFTRSFYKHILGRTVDYRDVEALDPEYYKSLVWMLENDITDIIDLTFSIETDFFGTKQTVDLRPDGRNIPVTETNKHEYVTLVTEQKLTTAIKDQINAFVEGFHDVIPAPLIQIFNEQELELLISGLPDIDLDDWKNNTEYQGYTTASPPVQWFWRAVRSFDQEERAKLLQFSTGTSKVPLEGFSQLQGSSGVQKFQIHKGFGGDNRLPSAHTCFNQVDLPQYDSYESLRANLFKAISECSTGFGFG